MFKSCLNVRTPAMLVWKGTLTWKKAVGIVTLWWCRQFTFRWFHRGSDSGLKQSKMNKNIQNLGSNIKKDDKTSNRGKNKQEQDHSPPFWFAFCCWLMELMKQFQRLPNCFALTEPQGFEGRWRVLFYQTAALTRQLWTPICWIWDGTKRSWERGMGRPGDLLGVWSRTRMNEKV